MGCPTQCILGENLTFTIQVKDSNREPIDVTGSLNYNVYEDETATAILTGTMTKLDSQTGFYSEQIACTAANGFELYKTYTIRATATVSGVSLARTYSFICLGYADAIPAGPTAYNYIGVSDVDNWPDDATGPEKLAIINFIEDLIERITKDYFYAKSFSITMDGNGKNKIFPSFMPDILSITSIKLSEITLNSSFYAFDTDCIFTAALSASQCQTIEDITLTGTDPVSINITAHSFIDDETVRLVSIVGISPLLDGEYVITKTDADNFTLNGTDSSDYTGTFTSGIACFASLAELHYLTDVENGVFPKGTRNIEIIGTYGHASCPAAIRQAALILARHENDPSLYTTYSDMASERLGDYSYSRKDAAYLTGVMEADRLIRNYIRKKPLLGVI